MHEGKYSRLAKSYALMALESDLHPETGQNWVTQFEEDFAKFAGANYAIGVNSGTSAIHAALLALGVGPGDEVISPALTVIMDAFSTLYTGATPVFVDVEQDSWNIDPKKIEQLITQKTKAVITVSWFGLPSNLREIKQVCNKFNIPIIDDSAETISRSGYQKDEDDKPTFRIFSFESKKHFSTGGEGGMLVTDNPDLAKRARQSAGLGYKHLSAGKGRTSLAAKVFQNPSYERFDALGFNYRMTPVTAAIGLGQLSEIDLFLESRIFVADCFSDAVMGCTWLIPQKTSQDGIANSYYSFGVRFLSDNIHGKSWSDFYDLFVSLGGHGFYSNCMNPYLEPVLRGKVTERQVFERGLAPIAESLQSQIMAFKTNYLDPEEAKLQAEILKKTIKMFEEKK